MSALFTPPGSLKSAITTLVQRLYCLVCPLPEVLALTSRFVLLLLLLLVLVLVLILVLVLVLVLVASSRILLTLASRQVGSYILLSLCFCLHS